DSLARPHAPAPARGECGRATPVPALREAHSANAGRPGSQPHPRGPATGARRATTALRISGVRRPFEAARALVTGLRRRQLSCDVWLAARGAVVATGPRCGKGNRPREATPAGANSASGAQARRTRAFVSL